MSDESPESPPAPEIPTVKFRATRGYLINPYPETGTQGLEVMFDDAGNMGLDVRGTTMKFYVSRDAALMLASLIIESETTWDPGWRRGTVRGLV